MVTVNMHEAKTQLSKLVERVENGEEVVIARSGKPVAKLVAVEEPTAQKKNMTPRPLGTMAGKLWVADDFDAPLPTDIEASFYGVTPEELERLMPLEPKKAERIEDPTTGITRLAKPQK